MTLYRASILIDPNDLEPIDALERCDAIFGADHIGLYDEARAELALLFDWRLLPDAEFLDKRLLSIIGRTNGRLVGSVEIASFPSTETALQALVRLHMHDGSLLSSTPVEALVSVVVDLPKAAVVKFNASLKAYTAYLGSVDFNTPSHFRTLVMGSLEDH